MVDRWFPLAVTQVVNMDGFTITLTTDVPCHLWLFYTFKEPWVHPIAKTSRGLTAPWWAYWCYVNWIVVEQDEPGDTTIHTFQITGLVTCNRIWFRFHGNIASVSSPSDSSIFEKHYTQPTPPPPAELAYSHCAVTANVSVTLWNFHGESFKALDSGIAKTLAIDMGINDVGAPVRIRFYNVDPGTHVPTGGPIWQQDYARDNWPNAPDHAVAILTIPHTAIVKDNWYGWCVGHSLGGYHGWFDLWHSAWCTDPLHTGMISCNNAWAAWNYDDSKDPWFELKA